MLRAGLGQQGLLQVVYHGIEGLAEGEVVGGGAAGGAVAGKEGFIDQH